ncbi:hypothetical protein CHGG_03861 [Chaetomium globosum CBS 148.51]|uniref:Uncharacterized protein n=1 Tax=Chaetomium globosum (strain ATCC 6205 / CBS 148.51 / DSM 1962 / NBRC 6347 / NRRL 1970) TaxID=306901 RepID=Q2H2Y5_CHAGB|nr:uncharacterized protein CHGG_03861 [Chaetomium globosum CBS 148.51]EAQ87242.1 hypothetical protein CHGG_03861 [Chaetomium globosum CBS 148.51]
MAPFFGKKHKEATKAGKEVEKAGTGNSAEQSQPTNNSAAAADEIAPAIPARNNPAPLLNHEDERFLERLISNDDDDDDDASSRPPLPPRPKTPDLVWEDSDSFCLPKTDDGATSTTATTTTASATPTKKPSRFSRLFHRKPSTSTALTVPSAAAAVPPEEADREWDDLNNVLARLGIEPTDDTAAAATTDTTKDANPAATTTTTTAPIPAAPSKTKTAALAASAEVQSLLRQFVVVLKDVMRGAPTAVDDLTALLDGRNDVLKRGFEKLPSSMQKLVTQLPKKLTSSLGPEVLAAAAEAQGLKRDTDASGLARFLVPKNLAGEGGEGEDGEGGGWRRGGGWGGGWRRGGGWGGGREGSGG